MARPVSYDIHCLFCGFTNRNHKEMNRHIEENHKGKKAYLNLEKGKIEVEDE